MNARITFRHLEAFRAVMLRKTVTGAAQMLCVSQPVVTRLLADLESRIGFALFDRVKGRLLPTAQADVLFDEVQHSLRGVDRILLAVDQIRNQQYGSLRIASAPVMALSFLPGVIAAFAATRPEASIALHMHSSRMVLDLVMSGQCDLGFAILQGASRGSYGKVLLSTRMVCALPQGHALAGRSSLQPEDLRHARFVSHPAELDVRMQIDSVFAAHGVQRVMHLESQTSHSLLAMVQAGAGVAIVDPLTAACHQGGGLVFVPFEPVIRTDFSLLSTPGRTPSTLQAPFVTLVRDRLHQCVARELILS